MVYVKNTWNTDTRGPNMGRTIGPYPKDTSENIIRQTAKECGALGYVRTSKGTWYIKHIRGNITDIVENLTYHQNIGKYKQSKFVIL